MVRVYEALAAACHREGVTTAFGLVGDGNVKLVHRLTAEHGIRYLAARHEAGAVAMASGFARSGGGTGFVTVTQGPGLTNALTALVAAAKARLPVVLFAGLPPTGLPGHPQAIDQHALMEVAGVAHQPVDPSTLDTDVAAAFARAAGERRPVAMFLPTDVQDAEAPSSVLPGDPWVARGPTGPSAGSDGDGSTVAGDLAAAAQALAAAERPLLVAGRGCLASPGAVESIAELADAAGALLATTLPVRGLFAGHPYAIGVVGGYATHLAVTCAERADVVVAFGCSLNYRATRSGRLFGDDTLVVQVDVAEQPAGASVPVDLAITGDAALAARLLTDHVADAGGAPASARTPELARRIAEGDVHDAHVDTSPADRVDPRALITALDRVLPAERSVTVDGGHSSGFPSIHLGVPDHHGYLFALEFASIGLGIGTAIGAAIARPERVSVLVVGDGSLLMSLPELETAVRESVPLVVVVMNDHAYTSELAILDNDGLPPDVGLLPTPSFAALATAMGATGATVTGVGELEELGDLLIAPPGPVVIDAQIDPAARGGWLKGAFDRTLDRTR